MSSTTPLPSPVLLCGYGYLGRAIAQRLESRGAAVIPVARSADGEVDPPVHGCNLSDRRSVVRLATSLESPPAAVVHCASSGRGGAESYRAVFVDGTRHLIEAFPGSPLVFTSSTSVYGQTDGEVVTEDSPAEPDRETGQLLLQAENQVLAAGGTVLRLAGIYGPERSVHLQRLLAGEARIESGAISRTLNQVHRDDAAAAVDCVLASRPSTAGHVFNVADDRPRSQRETYESLAEALSLPVPEEAAPNLNRKRAWTHKTVSNTRLRELGWQPQFPGFLEAVGEDPRLLPSIKGSP